MESSGPYLGTASAIAPGIVFDEFFDHSGCRIEPQGQAALHRGTRAPHLENIRLFAYNLKKMDDALRRFKSEIFRGLANPTRIAIVELLRDGELSAGQLIEELGIEQANASQHLAVLRAKQIVVSRKAGNQVYYSIRDRALIEVLEILRRYFYAQLSTTVNLLKQAAKEAPKSRAGSHR
jgi:ArsR family transcriptional regulator